MSEKAGDAEAAAVTLAPGGPGPPCVGCGGPLRIFLPGVPDNRLGVPGTWDIARCSACGLEQTRPLPDQPTLDRLYARYYNFGGETTSRWARWRERFLASRAYRLWLAVDGDVSFHSAPGHGRVLDIGCNEGRGLLIYESLGYDEVEGLEINPVAASLARSRGYIVHEASLATFKPADPYDVVIMSNVLEHLLDPAGAMRDARRLLMPGGELRISCPNAESWLAGLFGRHWINWHLPFHLTHFRADTLAEMLRRAGFEVRSIDHQTPALWVAQTAVAALFARSGQPTRALRSSAIVLPLMALVRFFLFPLLWLGNRGGRGDCLVVVAQRPA